MSPRSRRWFVNYGLLFAVVVIRGVLPWLIVWLATPGLGPVGALTATLSGNPATAAAIAHSGPILLIGGGTFLLFLFFHWLFLEEKNFGLRAERVIMRQGVWFFAIVSVLLAVLVRVALNKEAILAFGAVLGSSAFFITHGFKEHAEHQEQSLIRNDAKLSDMSKLIYLEIIDATFSIDGVLGAFAFTLSVPLILIGNGIGALIVRQLTVGNIERIKKYRYLKNGAMYSILFLSLVMLANSFGLRLPEWISPVLTLVIVGYFFIRSQ